VTADVRPVLLARAAAALWPPREVAGATDLPAIGGAAAGLERSVTILSVASLVIVALTAGARVVAPYHLSDVGALLVLYAIGTFAVSRVPWDRMPEIASIVIVGAQILFVVSLTTVTGGGRSPYFVLYAPVLAIAGWHLRRDWVVMAVAAVAAVEWWRAMVVEGGRGSADQLMVALPLFAAIAALAHTTAQRLLVAVALIRRDQLRTAETLTAVRELAASRHADPLADASAAAARIFKSRARLLTFEAPIGEGGALLSRSEDGRRLSVSIDGADGTHGVLELDRTEPFSMTEARLAAMLTGTAGQAADGRRPGRGVHL
jgi:hypothetical protein